MSTQTYAFDPTDPEADSWADLRDSVPSDVELASMTDDELQSFVAGIPYMNEETPRGKLVEDLAKFREGGVPVACHRCPNTFVYGGTKAVYAPCTDCRTSTKILSPEGWHRKEADDDS